MSNIASYIKFPTIFFRLCLACDLCGRYGPVAASTYLSPYAQHRARCVLRRVLLPPMGRYYMQELGCRHTRMPILPLSQSTTSWRTEQQLTQTQSGTSSESQSLSRPRINLLTTAHLNKWLLLWVTAQQRFQQIRSNRCSSSEQCTPLQTLILQQRRNVTVALASYTCLLYTSPSPRD